MNLISLSKAFGLVVPKSEALHGLFCGCGGHLHGHKVSDASIVETYLASRKHRWPEMQRVMVQFNQNLAALVTKKETDLLKALGLPPIDLVRKSFIDEMSGREADTGEWAQVGFEFGDEKRAAHERIIGEWERELIGEDTEKAFSFSPNPIYTYREGEKLVEDLAELPIYQYFMLLGFSAPLKRIMQDIIANRPGNMTPGQLLTHALVASIDNPFLKAVKDAGAKRIRTKLGITHIKEVRKALMEMARTGKNALSVGRYLHRKIGEGELWYWLRIARSEMVLAYGQAFIAQAREAGVKYQKWYAAKDACEICQTFHEGIWPLGQGPMPVASTHPHCLCVLIPYFFAANVQPPWEGRNPYNEPYKPSELEQWRYSIAA